jgi:hypothetical protein
MDTVMAVLRRKPDIVYSKETLPPAIKSRLDTAYCHPLLGKQTSPENGRTIPFSKGLGE